MRERDATRRVDAPNTEAGDRRTARSCRREAAQRKIPFEIEPEPGRNKVDNRDPTSYQLSFQALNRDRDNDHTRARVPRDGWRSEESAIRDQVPRHWQKPRVQEGRQDSDVRAFQRSNQEN